mmetsp:Transcript_16119/g.46263  ORF Transcript_16119/g.46263 Transcript_16119/m.46263 type:complete len:480 (+) Transcript_16119:180-1619(+)
MWRYIVLPLSSVLCVLYLFAPDPHRSWMHSLLCGYIGRWDLAKEAAEQSIVRHNIMMAEMRSGEGDDTSMEEAVYGVMGVDYSMSSFLDRLADCQVELGEIDEAIATLRDRVVAQYIREAGQDDLDVAYTFVKASYLYRERGQYEEALDMLEEAQAVFLSNGGSRDDRDARRRELTDNQAAITRVQELMQLASEQEEFLQAYVDMASRWNFVAGSAIPLDDDSSTDDSTASSSEANVCPNIANLKRRHGPSSVIVFAFVGALGWKIIRFVWAKPTRLRGSFGFVLAILLSLYAAMYWNWEGADGLTDRLNFEADVLKMAGRDQRALQKYDAARCSVLANPHEEALLVHPDIVLETFIGAAYIFGSRGQLEALEMLVKDIAGLLAKDSGQLEPSFDLYNFYLYLSSLEDIDEAKSKHYFNLAEKEGRAYTRMVTAEVEEHIQQFLDRDSNKPKNETEKTLKKPEKKEEEDNGPEIAVGYI